MKNFFTSLSILFFSIILTSCEAIGNIFGAGVSVGIFIAIFVIIMIIFLITRMFRRK